MNIAVWNLHEFAIEDIKDCPVRVAVEMIALAAVLHCAGPKGGKGPGKGPGKGQAKGITWESVRSRTVAIGETSMLIIGGKAPEPAMTYKQKQEAELAAKAGSLILGREAFASQRPRLTFL